MQKLKPNTTDREHNARLIAVLCGSGMAAAFYIAADLRSPMRGNAVANEYNSYSLFGD